MKIYLAHPISGLSYDEVVEYYSECYQVLRIYEIYCPMTAKPELRTEKKLRSFDYSQPTATNKAIVHRDCWMVEQADVVYVNLLGTTEISIGCVAELAWAWHSRKHTVISMEKENVHMHAFVIEMANIIWDTHEEAIQYLNSLARMEMRMTK